MKIVEVVAPNPASWEAGAVDLEGAVFKPIGGKKVALHFGRHLEFVRNALLLDYAAEQLHVFNEGTHLVRHH